MTSNSVNVSPAGRYSLSATTDRKKIFRERLKAKIRDAIGMSNPDQEDKEELLAELCSKIISIYIRSFESVENSFGGEFWGHNMPSDIFHHLTKEHQDTLKRNARTWINAKTIVSEYAEEKMIEVCRLIHECTNVNNAKFNERRRKEDSERRNRTADYLGKPVRTD